MSISVSAFVRLQKLMAVTFSDHDGEALNAIRAANALLARHGYRWDDVFAWLVAIEYDPDEDGPGDEAVLIEAAFSAIFASDPRGGFADFIESLRHQWLTRGSLSAKQKAALFGAAQRAQERRAAR